MRRENVELLDVVGELMENVYQIWKILYDGSTNKANVLQVYVQDSRKLLEKIAKGLNLD